MPIAPIEAALHGLPLVLSDLPCYKGVWQHGANALLHPVGDVDLLKSSIETLFGNENLKSRLKIAAQQTAMRFTEPRTVALMQDVLLEAKARYHLRNSNIGS